jgi:hypothetical protein
MHLNTDMVKTFYTNYKLYKKFLFLWILMSLKFNL